MCSELSEKFQFWRLFKGPSKHSGVTAAQCSHGWEGCESSAVAWTVGKEDLRRIMSLKTCSWRTESLLLFGGWSITLKQCKQLLQPHPSLTLPGKMCPSLKATAQGRDTKQLHIERSATPKRSLCRDKAKHSLCIIREQEEKRADEIKARHPV